MLFFLDTEFIEDGRTIDLISIALVAGDGHFYYGQNTECRHDLASPWVRANVLPKLVGFDVDKLRLDLSNPIWNTRRGLRNGVYDFVRRYAAPYSFWGDFASYDWVAFCQLFGQMIDLPRGWPMYCNDVQQHVQASAINPASLPVQDPDTTHDALADARHLRAVCAHLRMF